MALNAVAIDLALPAFDDIRGAFDLGADSNETARIITTYFLGMAVAQLVWGPVIAPAIGAGIVAIAPWQWVFWTSVLYCALVAIWALRMGESLPPEQRMPIRLRGMSSAFGRILRTPATVGPLVAMIAGMGPFTSFLASSELIVGEIYGRPAQFPIVFGVIGIANGITSVANGRLVSRFGMRRVVDIAYRVYLPVTLVTLAIALTNGGVSSFWWFIPAFTITLSFHLLFIPNLNAMAMEPLGDIAGSAAAILGAVSMAAGAVLGSVIDSWIDSTGTVVPIAWGLFIAAVIGLWAVRWTLSRAEPAPVG